MDTNPKKIMDELAKAKDGGRSIYLASLRSGSEFHKYFDYKTAFDLLLLQDKVGYYVSRAGGVWETFDHKKGIDYFSKLADKKEVNKETPEVIFHVGRTWKHLTPNDFNVLFKALIKVDKTGEWIYSSGCIWKRFDYKTGFSILKKISEDDYFKRALKHWPKTARETLDISKEEAREAQKIKDKKFVLENSIVYPHNENEELNNLVRAGEKASEKEANRILREIIKKDSIGRYIFRAGVSWKNFNVKEALIALGNIPGSARWIYKAGGDWKDFDFEMGLDALYKVDVGGSETMYASFNWDHFNFKKGLDVLIKNDKDGMNIYSAGLKWPRETFDFNKAFEALITKKNGHWIFEAGRDWSKFNYKKGLRELANRNISLLNRAKKEWPLITAKVALSMSKIKAKQAPKIKDRKFVLESSIEKEALSSEGTAKEILYKGIRSPDFFDFKKGFIDLLKASPEAKWVFHAGKNWKNFDYKKGLDELIKRDKNGFCLTMAGDSWKKIDHEKTLDALIKVSEGKYIVDAGEYWQVFNHEKALDALIKKDRSGELIYKAGLIWKEFNHEKALDALSEKNKSGELIFKAGLRWRDFNYKKGLDALALKDKHTTKKHYFFEALYHWPKSAIETLNIIKKSTEGINKTKDKKMTLESTLESFSSELKGVIYLEEERKALEAESIYKTGVNSRSSFDFEKGLDKLIELDSDGNWILEAGKNWSKFDFKKGQDALAKVEDEFSIAVAGVQWPQFDFDKGLDDLIRNDKKSIYLRYAEKKWKKFNYNKAMEALLRPKVSTETIIESGTNWKKFDYKKAMDFLKKYRSEKDLEEALLAWPISGMDAVSYIKRKLGSIKKTQDKKMTLESVLDELKY